MNLEDAIVEDTFWWCCPECEFIQTGLCGDEMVCCHCEIEFEPDDFNFEASSKKVDDILLEDVR